MVRLKPIWKFLVVHVQNQTVACKIPTTIMVNGLHKMRNIFLSVLNCELSRYDLNSTVVLDIILPMGTVRSLVYCRSVLVQIPFMLRCIYQITNYYYKESKSTPLHRYEAVQLQ